MQVMSENIGSAIDVVASSIVESMEPDPELRLDSWSEANVIIPKGSATAGPYRLAHTPYARRVLQCLSPTHRCSRVVVMAASQMLKTQVFVNAALGWIDLAPANILALEPTDKLAKRLSSRLAKAIEACDAVREKVAKPRSRDARNTIDTKEFDGGALHITTAGAAANLAEIPARYVFCDEVDRMDASVDSEGDPVELAEARATTYEGMCKLYHVSSPTTTVASKIAPMFAMGTQESYHVPCPHCGHLHPLDPENFRYDYDSDTDNVDRAWFVCPDCGAEINESDKTTMLPDIEMGGQARWVAASTGDGETVSFHINAFYAPVGSITWLRLARQHARAELRKAKGDNSGIQVYTNTRMALPYDDTHATTTADALRSKAEDYPLRIIPAAALVVTAAVDTQPDRLEVQVEAWGPGMEHWVIDHIVLAGDPTESESSPHSVWRALDRIVATPFAHASGAPPIPISAYSIDTGGANTQDVYNYGSKRRKCTMIKGASRANRPIISSAPSKTDITWGGKLIPQAADLWSVGTDVAKDWLHNRIKLASGPGAMHISKHLPHDWADQFLAEAPRISYSKGQTIRRWLKRSPSDRNEALDLSVYNLATAYRLGLHKWTALDWETLRKRLIPAQITPDLFADQPAPQLQAMPQPAPPAPPAPTVPPVPTAPPETPPAHVTPPPQAQPATPPASPNATPVTTQNATTPPAASHDSHHDRPSHTATTTASTFDAHYPPPDASIATAAATYPGAVPARRPGRRMLSSRPSWA